MKDFRTMTPAEKEADIRGQFEAVEQNIDALLHQLMFERQYYEELRAIIAEIDLFGAEDYFCCPTNENFKVFGTEGEFDF